MDDKIITLFPGKAVPEHRVQPNPVPVSPPVQVARGTVEHFLQTLERPNDAVKAFREFAAAQGKAAPLPRGTSYHDGIKLPFHRALCALARNQNLPADDAQVAWNALQQERPQMTNVIRTAALISGVTIPPLP